MSSFNTVGGIYATAGSSGYSKRDTHGAGLSMPATQSAQASDSPSAQHAIDPRELHSLVEALNLIGQQKTPYLDFRVDAQTGYTVVEMRQRETGELLRQIPSEEFLTIAKMILETTGELADQPGRWLEVDA